MRNALKPAIGATMIALAAMSGAANAAPLTTLYFTQVSAYNPGSLVFDNSQGLVPGFANANTTLQWTSNLGAAPATSSLTINSYTSTTSPSAAGDLNGEWNANEWFRIDRLIQNNQILTVPGDVPNPNPLWIADIIGNFSVYQNFGFTGLLLEDLGSETTIKYWETTNTTGCPGSPNPLGSVCDDVYTVMQLSLAPLSFILDGYKYEISFRLEPGLNTLVCDGSPDAACDAEAGAQPVAGELFKVYAREGFDSQIFVAAAWTATRIPEPGILGLLGIGLVGMGLSARRRGASAA